MDSTLIDDKLKEKPVRPEDMFGMFENVSSPPNKPPMNFFGQIKVFRAGTLYRLYWYDTSIQAWHYVTGT